MKLARVLSPGLRVSWKRFEARSELAWHEHGMPTLCVVIAGAAAEEDARGTRARAIGDVVFRPLSERHRDAMGDAGAELVTLELEAPAAGALELLPRSTVYLRSDRAARVARLARAELRDARPGAELELLALAYQLLAPLGREPRAPSAPPGWLARVRERVADDLRANPTLAELAAAEGVAPHRLAAEFRRHYGASVAQFLRRARVERASALLGDTDLDVAEVALAAGFCDQSHLTHVFRRHTGTTPAAYRRRMRAE